jgi:hypothetical protein
MESSVQTKERKPRTTESKPRTKKPNIIIEVVEIQPEPDDSKKGRKPKGGKLIMKQSDAPQTSAPLSNIILHLKCSMKELNEYISKKEKMTTTNLSYNPEVPPSLLTYNMEKQPYYKYDETKVLNNNAYTEATISTDTETYCSKCKTTALENDDDDNLNLKDINSKLKKLKIILYKNQQQDKKSACFWCTYEYDNPSCYIPKYENDEGIFAYGSFCRPECATAYLMQETLDDSTKFERYHLLNRIYGKTYGFTKNIKPAPNPYYTLEKYYGNLTIQEYRKLFKNEYMLLTIDRPMTRLLPELHEETDSTILNRGGMNKSASATGSYKVKRQSEKTVGLSKNNIIKNTFGITD